MNRLSKFLFASVMTFLVSSTAVCSAREAESASLFCLSIEKRFNDYFQIQLHQQLWLDNNFTNLERYMPFVDFKVTLLKDYVYFDALYFYRYQHKTDGSSVNTHRYQLGLSGGYKWQHFKLSGYSRFESDYIKKNADLPYNRCYWRNRLVATAYLKEGCKWSPYSAIEVFNTMNWPGDNNGVERLWFEIGSMYSINKTFSMDFKIREILPTLDKTQKISTYIGVGCNIKL